MPSRRPWCWPRSPEPIPSTTDMDKIWWPRTMVRPAIVGHEQYPDGVLTNLFFFLWVSGDDMKRWFGAIKLDETEDFS
mgnify:CR=1 FL=1